MMPTETSLENLTLSIVKEMHVNASLDVTFSALLAQLAERNERPDGTLMPMKLEPWPGGRWFRDLGDGNGHFWANVQAIKRPTLIEFCGPLFASYPFLSNVQYRLTEVAGGTLIGFRHTALGFIQDEHRNGVVQGWAHILKCTREHAEGPREV